MNYKKFDKYYFSNNYYNTIRSIDFEQFIFIFNSSLKVVRMLNDSFVLRDITNMINLKAIFKIIKSRHLSKNINFIQNQDSKISYRNYIAKNFYITIFYNNNKSTQFNDSNYFD